MLTALVGVLAGFIVSGLFLLTHLVRSVGAAIVPGLIALTVVVVLILRRTQQLVEPLVKEAERHIAGGRTQLGLDTLARGYRWGRWHPLIPAQLDALVGTLQFDLGKYDEAEPRLRRALRWPWQTKAMLGVVYFKRRDEAKMIKAFDLATSAGDKEPLSWTLYAYCLLAQKKRDEALKVLERGLKLNPKDDRLQNNLELAREGKKLKTAPYGDKWLRFRLDGEAPAVPKAMRGFAVRPGFRQRPRKR